jgi:predicted kinase
MPVIGLDDLRGELEVDPAVPQSAVDAAARERAREYLRRGETFAWNATNLSRQVRGECINLFTAYRVQVWIVYVEVSEGRLHEQNRV